MQNHWAFTHLPAQSSIVDPPDVLDSMKNQRRTINTKATPPLRPIRKDMPQMNR